MDKEQKETLTACQNELLCARKKIESWGFQLSTGSSCCSPFQCFFISFLLFLSWGQQLFIKVNLQLHKSKIPFDLKNHFGHWWLALQQANQMFYYLYLVMLECMLGHRHKIKHSLIVPVLFFECGSIYWSKSVLWDVEPRAVTVASRRGTGR